MYQRSAATGYFRGQFNHGLVLIGLVLIEGGEVGAILFGRTNANRRGEGPDGVLR